MKSKKDCSSLENKSLTFNSNDILEFLDNNDNNYDNQNYYNNDNDYDNNDYENQNDYEDYLSYLAYNNKIF